MFNKQNIEKYKFYRTNREAACFLKAINIPAKPETDTGVKFITFTVERRKMLCCSNSYINGEPQKKGTANIQGNQDILHKKERQTNSMKNRESPNSLKKNYNEQIIYLEIKKNIIHYNEEFLLT